MYTSLFDIFSIGIGPSSSHTMGPMRAAAAFVNDLRVQGRLSSVNSVQVSLYGSLALTGEGHGTPGAVVYGLLGLEAETLDLSIDHIGKVQSEGRLLLGGEHSIGFCMEQDITLEFDITLPEHANGMRCRAWDAERELLHEEYFFSIGKTYIDRRSNIKRKCINKIIIGRAICCSLNLWDYIIQFLLNNLFGYHCHLPAVFL